VIDCLNSSFTCSHCGVHRTFVLHPRRELAISNSFGSAEEPAHFAVVAVPTAHRQFVAWQADLSGAPACTWRCTGEGELVLTLSHSNPSLPGLAKAVNNEVLTQDSLAVSWRFWLNPNSTGRWQGPNGQAMREKWRGSAAGRARTGWWQAAPRLQTALQKSGSQSVSTFS